MSFSRTSAPALTALEPRSNMNLASNLKGKTINGWAIKEKLSKQENATGGAFSSGYFVEHSDGRKAFLKAINIGYAIKMFGDAGGSRVDILNDMTANFRYERDLLNVCGDAGMDHVIIALDSGEYAEEPYPYFVPYLVFELCEKGDVRRHASMFESGLAWRLRVFHGVCVGLMQLHKEDIAHQDLKPSNVLIANNDKAKIADLGRSTFKGPTAKFTAKDHCGDIDYMPIELQYDHFEEDWDTRRKGADLYMLGGILAFLASNVHIFALILQRLPTAFRPRSWGGRYVEILSEVRSATFDAIEEVVMSVDNSIRIDMRNLLQWLCEPDPKKRGHPKGFNSGLSKYSLERIVAAADLLARRAFIRLKN